ncbi:MAG: hypothetical protein H7177_00170 [Rhizobacter sp.]|nr:hypothetical protein [Bacteriovorax sp.]
MKNKSLALSVLVLGVLSSCSSYKNTEETRKLASKDYECSFKETIDGQKSSFVFTPDNLKLIVTNDKYGTETLFLEEDNFISGGFSYVQDKASKGSQWPVKKIEFLSFTSSPKVTINFKRTPASAKEQTIVKYCE